MLDESTQLDRSECFVTLDLIKYLQSCHRVKTLILNFMDIQCRASRRMCDLTLSRRKTGTSVSFDQCALLPCMLCMGLFKKFLFFWVKTSDSVCDGSR